MYRDWETGSVPGQKQTNVTLNGTKDQPSSWDNNEYGGGNAKCDKCGKWFISGSPCTCPKEKVEYKTDEGRLFEGYGTALKPAHEPCVLARKPIEGTVADNVLKHGTGGLNIDGTRITTGENLNGGAYSNNRETSTNMGYRDWETDRKSTRLNSSHEIPSRMPSSA